MSNNYFWALPAMRIIKYISIQFRNGLTNSWKKKKEKKKSDVPAKFLQLIPLQHIFSSVQSYAFFF